MISDTISDAAYEIRNYLENWPNAYPDDDPVVGKIKHLLTHMDSVREALDTPPNKMDE